MNDIQSSGTLSQFLNKIIETIGRIVMHVYGILVVVVCLQVILRYVFENGLVALEELEWHLWSVGFLFGLSYCVIHDSNIRMDLLYRKFSPLTRECLDAFALLFLVAPFIFIMIVHGLDFTASSWRLNERSDAPLGLPYRWLIKATIPIGMGIFGLAVIARVIRFVELLTRRNNGPK